MYDCSSILKHFKFTNFVKIDYKEFIPLKSN